MNEWYFLQRKENITPDQTLKNAINQHQRAWFVRRDQWNYRSSLMIYLKLFQIIYNQQKLHSMLVSQLVKKLADQNPAYLAYFTKMTETEIVSNLSTIIKDSLKVKPASSEDSPIDIRVTSPPSFMKRNSLMVSKQVAPKITSTNVIRQPPQKIMGKPKVKLEDLPAALRPMDYASSNKINPDKSKPMIDMSQSNITNQQKDKKQEDKKKKNPLNFDVDTPKNVRLNNKNLAITNTFSVADNPNNFKSNSNHFTIINSFSVDFIPLHQHQAKEQDRTRQTGKIVTTKNVNNSRSPQNQQEYLIKQQRKKHLKENNQKLAKLCEQQMKIISHLQLQQRRNQLSRTHQPGVGLYQKVIGTQQLMKSQNKIFKRQKEKVYEDECSCCSSNESELFQQILRERHQYSTGNLHKNSLKTYKITDDASYLVTSSQQTPRNYLL